MARATPTFDENRVKSIVVPPQLFGEKRHKAHQILVPPHIKIPTYEPEYHNLIVLYVTTISKVLIVFF